MRRRCGAGFKSDCDAVISVARMNACDSRAGIVAAMLFDSRLTISATMLRPLQVGGTIDARSKDDDSRGGR
jgi:hypothetical protein